MHVYLNFLFARESWQNIYCNRKIFDNIHYSIHRQIASAEHIARFPSHSVVKPCYVSSGTFRKTHNSNDSIQLLVA